MQRSATAAAAAVGMDEQLAKCPRCDSTNTKFCYYNNYNLSQPRHFCKSCRRYWTKGGALRNVPIGGGSRKNASKRPSSTSSSSTPSSKRASTAASHSPVPKPEPLPIAPPALDAAVSFSSLLASNCQFESFVEGLQPVVSPPLGLGLELQQSSTESSGGNENRPPENFLGLQVDWVAGWPDLAIYTPGSGFQ